eukprot:17666-Rhodomonas_salina.3
MSFEQHNVRPRPLSSPILPSLPPLLSSLPLPSCLLPHTHTARLLPFSSGVSCVRRRCARQVISRATLPEESGGREDEAKRRTGGEVGVVADGGAAGGVCRAPWACGSTRTPSSSTRSLSSLFSLPLPLVQSLTALVCVRLCLSVCVCLCLSLSLSLSLSMSVWSADAAARGTGPHWRPQVHAVRRQEQRGGLRLRVVSAARRGAAAAQPVYSAEECARGPTGQRGGAEGGEEAAGGRRMGGGEIETEKRTATAAHVGRSVARFPFFALVQIAARTREERARAHSTQHAMALLLPPPSSLLPPPSSLLPPRTWRAARCSVLARSERAQTLCGQAME